MTILQYPGSQTLDFGTTAVRATVLRDAVKHRVSGRATVVNLGAPDATIHARHDTRIPALGSATVVDTDISGHWIAVFSNTKVASVASDARRNWHDFYGARGGTPGAHPELLRSPQHPVGTVALDKAAILRQPELPAVRTDFDLRLNLWFSPAGTACGIHHEHEFLEVHTQLAGLGRMQKFNTPSPDSLYEEYLLSEGNTNPPTFCSEHDSRFSYPWHQYFADTDCVWLAAEYHAR